MSRSGGLLRHPGVIARRLTAFARALPDFLVVGAAKAGTTSLYEYLSQHPDVRPAARKEVHYFDVNHDRGPGWYRARFPVAVLKRRTWITGEASPYYLQHPEAPERVRSLLPGVRLIAVLRDPVERAHSHWRHYRRSGEETRPFADVLDEEERLLPELERRLLDGDTDALDAHRHLGLLARGRYAEQLERWLKVFPREQLLVLESEELFTRPADAYARTLEFLGLRPFTGARFEVHNRGSDSGTDISPTLARRLARYYAEPDRRLVALLGHELSWTAAHAGAAVSEPPEPPVASG